MKITYTSTAVLPDLSEKAKSIFKKSGVSLNIGVAELSDSDIKYWGVELSASHPNWKRDDGELEEEFLSKLPVTLARWLRWDGDKDRFFLDDKAACVSIAAQYADALETDGGVSIVRKYHRIRKEM